MNDWIMIAGAVSVMLAALFIGISLHAGVCLIKCEQQKGQTDEL